jgi:hypothetical protein
MAPEEWTLLAPPHNLSQQVRHTYRAATTEIQTDIGLWIQLFLDKTLGGMGLVCSPVEGSGICGYQTIINLKAGRLPVNFRTLKTKTLDFLNTNNKVICLLIQRAGGVSENMDTFMQRIQHSLITDSLITDGANANHNTLQPTAWKLETTIIIVIHDTFDFHEIELTGRRPWCGNTTTPAAQPIHIAYCRHQRFSLYDAQYKPVTATSMRLA